MSPPRIWKTGEPCTVTAGKRSVDATVALASPTGVSLAVTFEALSTPYGLYLNGVALQWDDARGAFVELQSGESFELTERGRGVS